MKNIVIGIIIGIVMSFIMVNINNNKRIDKIIDAAESAGSIAESDSIILYKSTDELLEIGKHYIRKD